MTVFENDKFLEADIKALVLNKLVSNGTLTNMSTIVNELNVNRFARRVDLALVNNNCFTAIEIKSDSDNLSRLVAQTETYLCYFDKVIIVAASRHIEQILRSVPQNVGVWEVSDFNIIIKQRGRKKPVRDKHQYIKLMNVGELCRLANQLKIPLSDKRRSNLESALIDAPLKLIRSHTLSSISRRYRSTSLKLHRIINSGKKIEPPDITLLSKYKQQRELNTLRSNNNKNAWNEFNQKTEDDFYVVLSKD